MDNRPIGVFDSGLGGLTAVRRLSALLPCEDIIYFGDTGRVPYGGRSPETIRRYAVQDMNFLRTFDLKAIVIACGTVSSISLPAPEEEPDFPIFGVVVPTARRAIRETRNGRIGVIATQATISAGAYRETIARFAPDMQVFDRPCPLFVPLAENGRFCPGDVVIETVAEEYLAPLRDADIDTLILGCTHYPLLADVIQSHISPDVALVDSGASVAERLAAWMKENDLCAESGRVGTHRWYVSDEAENFHRLASVFLGQEITEPVEQVAIETY